jgi:hypothetical protein
MTCRVATSIANYKTVTLANNYPHAGDCWRGTFRACCVQHIPTESMAAFPRVTLIIIINRFSFVEIKFTVFENIIAGY